MAFTLNACPGCFQIDQIKCWTIIFKQKYSSLSFNAWVHCTFYNCFDHLCIFTLLHIHFTITITLCRRLRMRSTTTNVLSALWITYLPIRFVILLSINRVKIVQCTDLRAMGHCDPNRITDLCLSFYLHPNIPDRLFGAKMNILSFSFTSSLQIKRIKSKSWILSINTLRCSNTLHTSINSTQIPSEKLLRHPPHISSQHKKLTDTIRTPKDITKLHLSGHTSSNSLFGCQGTSVGVAWCLLISVVVLNCPEITGVGFWEHNNGVYVCLLCLDASKECIWVFRPCMVKQMLYVGKALKGKIPYTWHFRNIKIPSDLCLILSTVRAELEKRCIPKSQFAFLFW